MCVEAKNRERQPCLSLCPAPRADGSIALKIGGINDHMLEFLNCDRQRNYQNLPVSDLLVNDIQTVDEWVEYVVRVRAKPTLGNYDHAQDGRYAKTILQFYSTRSEWRLTTIVYDSTTGQVDIVLEEVQRDWQRISSWQWREICQSSRLGKASLDGSYWEVCLREQWIFLSKAVAREMGVGEDALVVPVSDFVQRVVEEDREAARRAMERVEEGRAAFYCRAYLADGTVAHFNTVAVPAYDQEGNYTRILGRTINITQTKRDAEKLEVSENRFRNIVENSADLFVSMDTKGIVTYASPNLRAMLGRNPRDVVGGSFLPLLAPVYDKEKVMIRFRQAAEGKSRQSVTVRAIHRNGCTVWLRVGVSTVLDRQGRVLEICGICRDITVERLQQEELRYMVNHDALTDVYNRFWFENELVRIEREKETGVGLIMADLNGLKLINDAFGHNRGDEMLVRAARLFQTKACGGPVARVGGDEFVILLRNVSQKELEKVSRNITANNQRELRLQEEDMLHIPLSVSCGIAYREVVEESMNDLHQLAEGRMYRNKLLESRSLHSQVISSLREALKSHNLETSDHMARMEKMMLALGKRLNLPDSEFDRLVLLASLHDIGKVAIPHNIINKPGPLSEEEWAVMRSHSEVGSRIALSSQELSCIADEICYHHERWDGTGYPHGMRGEDIPLLSRIVSVVDTYDVMTNRRVYKEPIHHNRALRELKRCSGTQFDPWIVEQFVEIMADARRDSDDSRVAVYQC